MKFPILALLPVLVLGNDWRKELMCESEKRVLLCAKDEKISIEKAFYGRANDVICPSSQIRTTKCEAENTMKIIGNSCNGRNTCEIEANSIVLGDPCEETSKYLEVHYLCHRPSKFPTTAICEGESKSIGCPTAYVIKIKKGFYGRQDWTTCPHPSIKNVNCKARRSLRLIRKLCNGKRSCSVTATNTLFGDPCSGTYKYVEMSYKCTKQETSEPTCLDSEGNRISSDPFEKPGDCENFYQCSNGKLYVMPCAPGTVFNPEIGVCDHPVNVPGC